MKLPALPERTGVDRATFEAEIVPAAEPVVLRGLVAHWPAVAVAGAGDDAIAAYLTARDSGVEVDALMIPPGRGRRLFYDEAGTGFNFLRNRLPLAALVEQLQRYARFDPAPALAAQSALVAQCAPALLHDHPMPLLPSDVPPRLWVGNAIVTPAHFDESHNVAAVVAGERRFTLWPPSAIGDLYVGPVGHAPTGTPISLVDPDEPDFGRYPRFAQALAVARQAVLGPGDALYIPPLWWHHVASQARFNVLINYWWRASPAPSGLDALLHARLAFGHMPASQRAAWRAFFDQWVFGPDERSAGHIPPALQGVHGEITPEVARRIEAFLRAKLDPDRPGT